MVDIFSLLHAGFYAMANSAEAKQVHGCCESFLLCLAKQNPIPK